jgi:hypothetical protein
MVRVAITVNDIEQVLAVFDSIKVYRADQMTGPYAEVTRPGARINLYAQYNVYYFDDASGDTTKWYQTTYFNGSTSTESAPSAPIEGGAIIPKIGYTFNNYAAPPGEWGKLLTADDMRYTYLWGVDCQGSDIAQTTWTDTQFDYFVMKAVGEFEKYLTIDIMKHVYKTAADPTMRRGKHWSASIDYTDVEYAYEFDPVQWMNFGFVQLRHYPLISVERAMWYNPVHGKIMDMIQNKWLRTYPEIGQIQCYPTTGYGYGPYSIASLSFRGMSVRYPGGFEFDYTTGYPTSDMVPDDLQEVIGKWASVLVMGNIADGLMAGFSSSSVSLDGLSESFSSTQSPMNTWFGARTRQYMDEIKHYLKHNRFKHGAFPMSFVGS